MSRLFLAFLYFEYMLRLHKGNIFPPVERVWSATSPLGAVKGLGLFLQCRVVAVGLLLVSLTDQKSPSSMDT